VDLVEESGELCNPLTWWTSSTILKWVSVYLCHVEPLLLEHDARVLAADPGRVCVSRSALHPGGGGQESDLGTIEHDGGLATITAVEGEEHGGTWLRLNDPGLVIVGDSVVVRVDPERRQTLSALHTDTHILNALVFQRFDGALVTGAHISADGTARMDFDLPDVDNDLLRGLDVAVNEVITAALDVRAVYVTTTEALSTPGLIRSASVAPPPTSTGEFRVIEIGGLDRQACGGTHLSNTSQSNAIAVTKIENKGRRNRRVRMQLIRSVS
jgi:misacylated tRNA(Ala) deacylase